ncbi:MAG: TlpA family protein disulfide reductase [Caldilineaceae bacterium]|nr:TlpA family protein disulfide reductase [Caldilineaceae bacterium]
MVAALILAACGGSSAGVKLDIAKKVALADFPGGVGRGYPSAQMIAGGKSNPPLQPGSPAPDFALVLEDGSHLSLSDLQGRPIVINFWATWCGPCRLEMPELMRAAVNDPNLILLAVNVQEAPDAVAPFADDFTMTTPVVLDSKGILNKLYAVRGLPTTYFIDDSGAISAVYSGPLTPPALKERLDAIR